MIDKLIVKTVRRTSQKMYFLNGARISARDGLRRIERQDCIVEYR